MGQSLKFGLLSTISIKESCRDNVANDCFCSWFLGWFGCLGVFCSCYISLFCSWFLLSWVSEQYRCPLEFAYPFWCLLQGFIFSVAINTLLSYYLLKLNLTTLVLEGREKLKEIICSKIFLNTFCGSSEYSQNFVCMRTLLEDVLFLASSVWYVLKKSGQGNSTRVLKVVLQRAVSNSLGLF